MILKLVLRCVRKLFAGRIQTGHNYLLPPQVCGRLWRGFRWGVNTCSHQLIYFINKPPPFKFLVQYFFCLLLTCVYHLYRIRVHWSWIFSSGVLETVSGPYPNHTYIFDPPTGLWKVVERVTVFVIFTDIINTFIGFKAVTKVLQVWSCVSNCWPKGHKSPLG